MLVLSFTSSSSSFSLFFLIFTLQCLLTYLRHNELSYTSEFTAFFKENWATLLRDFKRKKEPDCWRWKAWIIFFSFDPRPSVQSQCRTRTMDLQGLSECFFLNTTRSGFWINRKHKDISGKIETGKMTTYRLLYCTTLVSSLVRIFFKKETWIFWNMVHRF